MRLFAALALVSFIVVVSYAHSESDDGLSLPLDPEGLPPEDSVIDDDNEMPATGSTDVDSSRRRSARLVQKKLADWPIDRILQSLYARSIPVPPGLNHEDLFLLLTNSDEVEHIQVIQDPAPTEHIGKGKGPAKKRSAGRPAGSAAAKKSKSTPSVSSNNDDIMLATLMSLKSSIDNVNIRLNALEGMNNSPGGSGLPSAPIGSGLPPAANPGFFQVTANPSAAAFPPPLQIHHDRPSGENVVTASPLKTWGTAVPAPASGSSFISPAAAISDSLRNHIIAGK